MPAGACQAPELLGLAEMQAAQERALVLMEEAIALLDQARQPYAAAHLQHAIEALCGPIPFPL